MVDDGRAIFPLAWAQGVGCGIMGLALGKKDELERLCVALISNTLERPANVLRYPPLYTFITTGEGLTLERDAQKVDSC